MLYEVITNVHPPKLEPCSEESRKLARERSQPAKEASRKALPRSRRRFEQSVPLKRMFSPAQLKKRVEASLPPRKETFENAVRSKRNNFV